MEAHDTGECPSSGIPIGRPTSIPSCGSLVIQPISVSLPVQLVEPSPHVSSYVFKPVSEAVPLLLVPRKEVAPGSIGSGESSGPLVGMNPTVFRGLLCNKPFNGMMYNTDIIAASPCQKCFVSLA